MIIIIMVVAGDNDGDDDGRSTMAGMRMMKNYHN
jgi:hypothetical protein